MEPADGPFLLAATIASTSTAPSASSQSSSASSQPMERHPPAAPLTSNCVSGSGGPLTAGESRSNIPKSITSTLRAIQASSRVARLARRPSVRLKLVAAFEKSRSRVGCLRSQRVPTSDFVARTCCARCCAMGCYRYPLAALLATAIILIASPFAAADPPLPGLHWFAPVLAGGGYCSEANALLHGLKSLPPGEAPPLRVTHHGDIDYFFYSGLPEDYARELDRCSRRGNRARGTRSSVPLGAGRVGSGHETARCPPEGTAGDTR